MLSSATARAWANHTARTSNLTHFTQEYCQLIRYTVRYPGCTLPGLAVAPRWDAEYEIIGGPLVNFQQEDPYIYHVPKRGYHAVFHGMDPWPSSHTGRHAYSLDGITWHGGDVDCWNNTVELVDGSIIELARRERPELVHDESGAPVALISSAVLKSSGDQSFTLVQHVRH